LSDLEDNVDKILESHKLLMEGAECKNKEEKKSIEENLLSLFNEES